ncbi:hypothetical protein Cni_G07044 [Canna indica]|uniref:WEB family protein n=1 Tax=Canna indica TaxID=4628 RepID=A0AAQ3Q5C3_9LILI|nr:hypothetical protein Cni_G07044 [Canna indica]
MFGLFENSNSKNTQGALKASRIRNGSIKSDTRSPSPMEKFSSPVPKPRVSIDRPTKSIESKNSNKNGASPDKPLQAAKTSELKEKLEAVEVDLKKAREQLAFIELEKIKVVEELQEAKRSADEMNDKLQEATAARTKAEESLETEKLRNAQMEQAGKEAAQKKEEEFQKELENVRCQHDQDVSALNSMTQELHMIKTELVDTTAAKEVALGQADEAKKTAKFYEEKADLLSKEVSHLKALHDSELDNVKKEKDEMIKKLNSEVTMLKHELERTKIAEVKLVQMESLVEKLQIEATDARQGESDVSMLVNEWRNKAETLKAELEEACQSEKSASDSLATMMVRLEESKSLFEDAESEISLLQQKINSLETEVAKNKADLEESDRQLDLAQQDALNIGKTVELLKLELHNLEEEKLQALDSEKVAASKVESLIEENNKLVGDLKISNDEVEKAKQGMEDLTSKLQAMSTEAREKEERLSRMQAEIEESQKEIERLNVVLRNTEERYEVMLDEARYEIVCLKKVAERSKSSESSDEWDAKELNFVNTITELEEEVASLKVEMAKMIDSRQIAKQETDETKAEVAEMLTKLRQVESAEISTSDEAEEPKYEPLQLKGTLLDLEEIQKITQENEDMCVQEASTLQKAKHLSALFKQDTGEETQENCELANGLKEYNLGKRSSEVPFKELEDHHQEDHSQKEHMKENRNWKVDHLEGLENGLASERDCDNESNGDDLEPKINGNGVSPTDGMIGSIEDETTSPTEQQQQQQQKKKKPLLHKFGNLLKKGNY